MPDHRQITKSVRRHKFLQQLSAGKVTPNNYHFDFKHHLEFGMESALVLRSFSVVPADQRRTTIGKTTMVIKVRILQRTWFIYG